MNLTDQLVILAGGRGSRLKHETINIPKPLVPLFGGECILGLLLNRHVNDFSEILILAGYQSKQIDAFVADRYENKNIKVLTEDSPAGTAGSLYVHQERLKSFFVVINGDTWFDSRINLASLELGPFTAGLVLTEVENASRYGAVEVKDSGLVSAFKEKGIGGNESRILINSGSYIFSKDIISYVTKLPCSLEMDIFPKLVKNGSIISWISAGRFLDIGVPDTLAYARKNREFFNDAI